MSAWLTALICSQTSTGNLFMIRDVYMTLTFYNKHSFFNDIKNTYFDHIATVPVKSLSTPTYNISLYLFRCIYHIVEQY